MFTHNMKGKSGRDYINSFVLYELVELHKKRFTAVNCGPIENRSRTAIALQESKNQKMNKERVIAINYEDSLQH